MGSSLLGHKPKFLEGTMERESEFGTIVGDMHSANVIRRDDGEYVVVPQGGGPRL